MSDPKKTSELIAAKRAEIMAKLANFQNSQNASNRAQSPQAPPPQPRSALPLPKRNESPQDISNRHPSSQTARNEGLNLSEIQKKIAQVSAQLATRPQFPPVGAAGKNAMPIGLDESGNIDLKAMLDNIPRRDIATAKANQRMASKKDAKAKLIPAAKAPAKEKKADPSKNPYLDSSIGVKTAPAIRRPRPIKFAQPGKFIQQAEKERKKAQLEKLKEEIAQNVKKAGMEVELGVSDKALKKEPPPAVEWWDAPFLANKTYDDLDDAPVNPDELSQLITIYVHHPIPIKAPSELNSAPVVRSLMLTKKERKKLRRQRRLEAQKEKQDKIRLGLLPPDPPKVKISNLMKVLGQEAIQDPTKIEAKVRKEMEMRQRQHELANAQRKLTPEERRAKIAGKQKKDQETSNEVAVFKVKNCSHPKHRYKIEVNAQQYKLCGMVIIHPKCHLVIVEGGPKSIKDYKKLMLRRIDWNDMPPPKHATSGSSNPVGDQMNTLEEGENQCFLVWEGQVKSKAFRKFTWRTFESEKMAREELSKWHVEHYWDAAVMATDEELAARQPEL